jgi:hypothetical protein
MPPHPVFYAYVFKQRTTPLSSYMAQKKKRFTHGSRRANAKKRNLGYLPLFDNPFPKADVRSIDMHHVNSKIVVPLPHRTHKTMTNHDTHCKNWIKKLFLLDIDTILSPEISLAPQERSTTTQDPECDQLRDYEPVCFDSLLPHPHPCREPRHKNR